VPDSIEMGCSHSKTYRVLSHVIEASTKAMRWKDKVCLW